MTKSFVQVPPQSTGKKIATEERTELFYSGLTVSRINVGDTLTGSVTGVSGVVTGIITEGYNSGQGEIYLRRVTGTFQPGEFLQRDGITIATVDSSLGDQATLNIQKVVITDPNNLEFNQRIDRFGATVNTFNEGSPVFGSFGTLNVGEPQTIKDYRFAYGLNSVLFHDIQTGGGIISYEGDSGAVLLTNSTAPGAISKRTSNYYHPYTPGVGHNIEMTVRAGDIGKNNLRRRWGYFDDNDGIFFESVGTELFIVLRSSVSGVVEDIRVPQSEWNKDRLDGSDSISFDLNPSYPNIYWMDMQWLGAGRVTFGVIEQGGTRLVAHRIENANNDVHFPYMRTASLPIRVEQENLGATSSSSEMRFVCASVKHASKIAITGTKHSDSSNVRTVAAIDGPVPILSVRPKLLFAGRTNRVIGRAVSSVFCNTSGGVVKFTMKYTFAGDNLVGANYFDHGIASGTEIDISATSADLTSYHTISTHILTPGQTSEFVSAEDKTTHGMELNLGADGISQPTMTIFAECLSGTADVVAAFNWEEIIL